jgi:hypothetical protein
MVHETMCSLLKTSFIVMHEFSCTQLECLIMLVGLAMTSDLDDQNRYTCALDIFINSTGVENLLAIF